MINETSTTKQILTGIPLGSVLGPLFFFIQIQFSKHIVLQMIQALRSQVNTLTFWQNN